MNELEFESILPRDALQARAREELRDLYDGLDGEVLDLSDV
jgi:hypothetical protein